MKVDVTVTRKPMGAYGTCCRLLSPKRPPREQFRRPAPVAVVCKELTMAWCVKSLNPGFQVKAQDRCYPDVNRAVSNAKWLLETVELEDLT